MLKNHTGHVCKHSHTIANAYIHAMNMFSCDYSPALRAQSIAVDEDTEYSFPSQQEIMQLTLPNSSLATISLPPDLLAERAAGETYTPTNPSVIATSLYS